MPVRRYNWTNIGAEMRSSARPYSAMLNIACCNFYNGRYLLVDLQPIAGPLPIPIQAGYTYTSVDLPTGSVDIHSLRRTSSSISRRICSFSRKDNSTISARNSPFRALPLGVPAGQQIFVSVGQAALIPIRRSRKSHKRSSAWAIPSDIGRGVFRLARQEIDRECVEALGDRCGKCAASRKTASSDPAISFYLGFSA